VKESLRKENIVTVREYREMVRKWISEGVFDERLPEVAALREIQQPAEYHGEGDAYTHTILAMEAVADDADPRVFWGALLHDIGKSVTTVFEGGRWRSVGHAEAGAEMVPAVMERLGLPELAADVAWLVRRHLFHFSWNLDSETRLSRNQRRAMEHPLFPLLLQVCMADAEASHGRSNKGDKIRMIAEIFEEEY
jgi:putative nucleotidyltransferase with HDIG domain